MAERSLECTECKRPVTIVYKEIVRATITCTEMCNECPILKSKLQGDTSSVKSSGHDLCCGGCGTSLESVRTGQPLGCMECFTVFAEYIINLLVEVGGIPSALKKKAQVQKLLTMHIGRSPQQTDSPALSIKLVSLNEALNDALKQENYEQAASIRDQIKALTDQHEQTS